MVEQLTAFVLTCLVVVLVPGPDFALVLRNATRGPRTAATAAAGIMVGNTILALLAVLGITALLGASEVLGTGIRIAGAAYLLYLGVRAFAEAFASRPQDPQITASPRTPRAGRQPGGTLALRAGNGEQPAQPESRRLLLVAVPAIQFRPAAVPRPAHLDGVHLPADRLGLVRAADQRAQESDRLPRPAPDQPDDRRGSGAVLVGVGGTILTKTLASA